MRRTILAVVTIVAASALVVAAASQARGTRTPSLAIESMYGPDLFKFYCATCHGQDGKGKGPVAATLKVPPADLTTIAKRNGGVFPKSRIEGFVTGDARDVQAHGSKEMPIWGPIFRSLEMSDPRARVRIANIVAHIESIQEK